MVEFQQIVGASSEIVHAIIKEREGFFRGWLELAPAFVEIV